MARSANGRHTQLSRVAMYAHGKPNCRFIAAVRGEVFEPCELDLQAVTDVKAILQPVPAGFDEEEDRLLVEAYMYVIENMWLLVSNHLEEMTGHFHDPTGLRRPLRPSLISHGELRLPTSRGHPASWSVF